MAAILPQRVRLLGAVAVLTAAAQNAGGACPPEWRDPRDLYGPELAFDVYRNGDRVGEHTVRFRQDRGQLVVDTRFDVEVSVLFFTAYRYSYSSTEVWRNGCLQSVSAETNDDGKRSVVTVRATSDDLRVEGPKGSMTVTERLYPTNHWNVGVLGSDQVLNTITGEVAQVDIADRGVDRVEVNGALAAARQYRYSGDLNVDVWYDEEGRWVKMRFTVKDGSVIEYVCRTCRKAGTSA